MIIGGEGSETITNGKAHIGQHLANDGDYYGKYLDISVFSDSERTQQIGDTKKLDIIDHLAPSFISASTNSDGRKVILSYDRWVERYVDPDAFKVYVDGARIDVTEAQEDSERVELTLAKQILKGQEVYLNYTDPTEGVDDQNAIQSVYYGTDAASLIDKSVTNESTVAAPVFQSASTSDDGRTVILKYNQELSNYNADPDTFSIKADSNSTNVTDVITYGYDIQLTLDKAIQKGQSVH